jgi:glucose-6-phosphate isomerase
MNLPQPPSLLAQMDVEAGRLEGVTPVERRLSQLRGAFADLAAYETLLAREDPVVYRVSTLEPAAGPGQLACGLAVLMPGRVGLEYYLTRGHFHARREVAEFYFGLQGEGALLLEHETTGQSVLQPLCAGSVVYVPGHTAHRTMNTGGVPLVYLGVYPADAGHDYNALEARNFAMVLVDRGGRPALLDRSEFLRTR